MKRSLSLVLDRDDNIYLTLETMEARELDLFVSKKFNSSDEIREYYKSVIDPFLEQYRKYLENKTHKRGRIVITELQDDLTIEEKRVIYKKSLIIFHEITKNKKFIDILQDRDYIRSANDKNYRRIFSEDYGVEIKFHSQTPSKYNRLMGQWRNVIKDYRFYYDLIRSVLKEYEEIRTDIKYKNLNLPTLDAVYNEFLKEKQANKEKKRNEKLETEQAYDEAMEELYKEDSIRTEEGISVRYQSGADVDGYPGDLERWDTSQVSTVEIEEGMTSGKTKTLNNGHHKLFDN